MMDVIGVFIRTAVDVLLVHDAYTLPTEHMSLGFVVVALAGLANAMGHSGTLFINRLKPPHFATGVSFAVVLYSVRFAFWVGLLWILMHLFEQPTVSAFGFAALIGFAHAPHLLAYFVFLPCLGAGVGFLLNLWLLSTVTVGLQQLVSMSILQVSVLVLSSWLLMQLLRRSLAYPLVQVSRALQQRLLQQERFKLYVDSHDLIDHIHRDVIMLPQKVSGS